MCIIIDANVASETFSKNPSRDAKPVLDWIVKKDGKMVIGGLLSIELLKLKKAKGYIKELTKQGRAIRVPASKIDAETRNLNRNYSLKSNDVHIIALARISGARVLFSIDKKLHTDFGNREIISNPRGSVYTSYGHRNLLDHHPSCKSYSKS